VTGPSEPRAGGQPAARAVPSHLVPLPPGMPLRQRPAEVLEALAGQFRPEGWSYIRSDGVLGVLSLPAVSVWTNGRVLWWATLDGGTTWPAADAPGAARRLAWSPAERRHLSTGQMGGGLRSRIGGTAARL
jgi:hypothetical protein